MNNGCVGVAEYQNLVAEAPGMSVLEALLDEDGPLSFGSGRY